MNQDTSPPEPTPDVGAEPTASVGELLIAARERWNFSAADIARQLRLALRQIEALEANRFDALPGNTFVRGFIRNYAKAVQEDPEVLLAAYEQMRPAPTQIEFSTHSEHIDFDQRPTPQWVWYAGGFLLLALAIPLAIYFALHDEENPPKPRALPSPVAAHTVPLGNAVPQSLGQEQAMGNASGVVASPGPAAPALANAASGPAPPAASAPAKAATATAIAVAPAANASTATSSPAPGTGAANVSMKFDGDAWVEVRDRKGKKIFSQLNRSGSEQIVLGQAPFSLVVGNAAQVRIAYNGKPVDLAPYIKVNVARLTLE